MTGTVNYRIGVPELLRREAARLYDQAFSEKFSVAIRNPQKRRKVLAGALLLDYAVAAFCGDRLVGLAGFHTLRGALTGGMQSDLLLEQLGIAAGLWAAFIFSIYSRQPQPSELLMDGIAVNRDFRSQGIGTRLLDELKRFGRSNGYRTIRLDVIETNPAARRLYERLGFESIKSERFGYLRWLLGFGASTTMVFDLTDDA